MTLHHALIPQTLKISVDLGIAPFRFTAELHGNRLAVVDWTGATVSRPYEVRPAIDVWRRFHEKLSSKKVGVWGWAESYHYGSTIPERPRTHWELEADYPYFRHAIHSKGFDCFPRIGGRSKVIGGCFGGFLIGIRCLIAGNYIMDAGNKNWLGMPWGGQPDLAALAKLLPILPKPKSVRGC